MSTDLLDALNQIYRIEAGLSITSPIVTGIKKVWPFMERLVVNDTPCFLNAISPSEIRFDSALLRTSYVLHPRLLVYNADRDQAAAIANAFIEPVIDAFCNNIKLGLSKWTVLGIRFNEEQPRVFTPESDSAGRTFLGLDFFVDLMHNAAKTYQIGAAP